MDIALDRGLGQRFEFFPVPFCKEGSPELQGKGSVRKLDLRRGPAERTGNSFVTYCPGGSRPFKTWSKRCDLKPREIRDSFMTMAPVPGVVLRSAGLSPPDGGRYSQCVPQNSVDLIARPATHYGRLPG